MIVIRASCYRMGGTHVMGLWGDEWIPATA